jgi:DNA-binding MarR family transcriptional regulator
VSDQIDIMERRKKILRLTPKGRRLVERLTHILEN